MCEPTAVYGEPPQKLRRFDIEKNNKNSIATTSRFSIVEMDVQSNECDNTVTTTNTINTLDPELIIKNGPGNLNEKFVAVLDLLDARVEKYRRDAIALQEKRDYLLMSIDLIKSNDLITCMSETEREDIFTYLSRVNGRLSTVELQVKTIRDKSQEDSLSKINHYIDMMITMGDPALSRQRCQEYLNACCSTAEAASECDVFEPERDLGPVDKRFENTLLGCTLDDQKIIKKRLQALMSYLNKQYIHN